MVKHQCPWTLWAQIWWILYLWYSSPASETLPELALASGPYFRLPCNVTFCIDNRYFTKWRQIHHLKYWSLFKYGHIRAEIFEHFWTLIHIFNINLWKMCPACSVTATHTFRVSNPQPHLRSPHSKCLLLSTIQNTQTNNAGSTFLLPFTITDPFLILLRQLGHSCSVSYRL